MIHKTHGLTLAEANEVVCTMEAMNDLRKDAREAAKWAKKLDDGMFHVSIKSDEGNYTDSYSLSPEEHSRLAEFFRASFRVLTAKAAEIEAAFTPAEGAGR